MTIAFAKVQTRALIGINAQPITVEVHLANGLPAFTTVGLPEAAVKESKDRVRAALLNSGFEFPAKRITVNLAPADLSKSGSWFDLPIAIGILTASGQVHAANIDQYEFIGELALNGELRSVTGVLPVAIACDADAKCLVVPSDNQSEVAMVQNLNSLHADHLLAVCRHFSNNESQQLLPMCEAQEINPAVSYDDLADVKGQAQGKRALEIAAAGGHSLLFVGPPGTGKSMLASRLPGILPALNQQQALQTAAIYSVLNANQSKPMCQQRPFRNPHHSSSAVAMVGGGSNPKPGEISLAHNGVLFLDELTEFSRATLEQLREPIEAGVINIARAQQSVQYPADFQLIAACNPCKCGYLGDGTNRCNCSATSIENYRSKISGPLMDRIDMHVHLPRISTKELQQVDEQAETSATVKVRVEQCQQRQYKRQDKLNHQLQGKQLEQYCKLDDQTNSFLALASERLHLSARAYHRILKLARTIADLQGQVVIEKQHIAEAIGYRSLDRL